MSNLISVTQRGPDILDPVRNAVGSSFGQELVGGVRKAGAILKNNPYSLLLSELIFPPALADGTLKGKPVYDDRSYEVMDEIPRNMEFPKPSLRPQVPNIRTGLLQIDPAVQRALDIQDSQRRAGISGTFLPE